MSINFSEDAQQEVVTSSRVHFFALFHRNMKRRS